MFTKTQYSILFSLHVKNIQGVYIYITTSNFQNVVLHKSDRMYTASRQLSAHCPSFPLPLPLPTAKHH